MPPLSLCELSLIEQLPPEVLTLIEQKAQNPQFAFVSSTFRLIAAAKIERVYLVGHRLSACQVTGSDLKVFFAAASRLKTLKISCFLERMFQDFLGSGVKSIENIEFAPGTILKEEVLAALLANLPYLKSLKAPRCDLTKMHLKHLKGAKYLERLDVSQSKYLFDGACKPLLSLTHLQALNLSSTEISGAALKILKPLPLLSLKIAGTAVSSSSLSFFLQERHLIELDIRNCPGLKEPLLWSLSLEKLELLKMDLWREVKGDLLLKWLEKVRPLRNFTFTGQDEKVLLAIAMRFTQLEVVHAVSLKESFEASLFPHLKKVHLSLRQLPRLAHFETRPLYLRLVVNREDPESLV
ncbi:MAG: hypothetical protein K0S07_215, partial [Chlamydiales bacterium]|nr:hypothetical protein [Chlamydiales bacterium]